jgi:murein DD-endopeptidase
VPKSTFIVAVLIVSALTLAYGQSRTPIVQAVDLSVPCPPVSFAQSGDSELVYELHVTNFQPVDVVLTAVRVKTLSQPIGLTTPIGPLAEYRDAELQRRLVRPGLLNDHATPQVVGPGMRAVVNMWIKLPIAFVPSIVHEVELDVRRPAGAVHVVVEGGASTVRLNAIVLDPPLRRGPWVAIYDPLLKGGHRTAIYTVDGRARIPGRFAIDFIALPAFGALAPDPAARPADGNGFGTEVIAVADGTIAAAVDDMPDRTPKPVPPESASGNYVSLDLGGGRFAFYEHLQQGSIVVAAGQRVTRGQVIAKLGSSGSTSIGPHLHFHVADANSLLASEGVAFVFTQFVALGEFTSIQALHAGEKWRPAGVATSFTSSRPSPNGVIHFP